MKTEQIFGTSPDRMLLWARICRVAAGLCLASIVYALAGNLILTVLHAAEVLTRHQGYEWALISDWRSLLIVPFGMMPQLILAFAVAQYLDYLSGERRGTGWLGRNLHVLLMIAAALQILLALSQLVYVPIALSRHNTQASMSIPIVYSALVPAAGSLVHALLYYGLADLIGRSRRFVEEARLTI